MSAAEGGKSDLKMPDDLLLPRFRVEHVPEIFVEKRYVDCDGAEIGVKSSHEIEIWGRRDHHGHVFDVHVERVDVYCRKCGGNECKALHPDPTLDEFLTKRDVHLMGYDNCGVFRVQVPKFCQLQEAEKKVKESWKALLVERMRVLEKKATPTTSPAGLKITPKIELKKPEDKPPEKPNCRHG